MVVRAPAPKDGPVVVGVDGTEAGEAAIRSPTPATTAMPMPAGPSMNSLQPQPELMAAAPLGFQLHALSAWALFAFWPFSRPVHVFSMPIGYLTSLYIAYRSRDRQPARKR